MAATDGANSNIKPHTFTRLFTDYRALLHLIIAFGCKKLLQFMFFDSNSDVLKKGLWGCGNKSQETFCHILSKKNESLRETVLRGWISPNEA